MPGWRSISERLFCMHRANTGPATVHTVTFQSWSLPTLLRSLRLAAPAQKTWQRRLTRPPLPARTRSSTPNMSSQVRLQSCFSLCDLPTIFTGCMCGKPVDRQNCPWVKLTLRTAPQHPCAWPGAASTESVKRTARFLQRGAKAVSSCRWRRHKGMPVAGVHPAEAQLFRLRLQGCAGGRHARIPWMLTKYFMH